MTKANIILALAAGSLALGLLAGCATSSPTPPLGGTVENYPTHFVNGLNVGSSDQFAISKTGGLSAAGTFLAKGGSYNFTTTTATTTLGLFVFGNTGTATTTLGVGSSTQKGCIELSDKSGVFYRVIVDGGALNVAAGRCN